jgi:hypothetical protein
MTLFIISILVINGFSIWSLISTVHPQNAEMRKTLKNFSNKIIPTQKESQTGHGRSN